MILAGIDVGTNTLRLLIAETGHAAFHPLYYDRKITRLGQFLDRTGELSEEARDRTLQALSDFNREIRGYKAAAVKAVGTSALRNASNSARFVADVLNRTSIEIRIISGEEEARATLLGVAGMLRGRPGDAAVAADPPSLFVVDIGGGSTELIFQTGNSGRYITSLPLGAVYLTERFIKHDPPHTGELDGIRGAVRECLDQYANQIPLSPESVLVGTAGTITTLASMDQKLAAYDPDRINRYVLRKSSLENILSSLIGRSLSQRRELPGLEPGREDIILAGALVTEEIMERFGFRQMVVSDWGLLEGIVFDLYQAQIRKTDHMVR